MRLIFILLSFFSLQANASSTDELVKLLDSKLSTSTSFEEAITSGKERAWVCKFCHGEDGNSTRDNIPNLASQNPKYLLRQFELFATKQRYDKTMTELATSLTAEDRVNIIIYYSTQLVKNRTTSNQILNNSGKEKYNLQCSSCHGNDGYGKELLPRLAGQSNQYLINTLNNYKTNPSKRPDSPMQSIVTTLASQDIEELAEYISTMK
ncbi:MAG: c-type cytochrome [Gammaproteobacteria bacterium]|nr:c-type cytochrome [Gammaproteobacteria bacterium]